MDRQPNSHKLLVKFQGFKFIQLANSSLLIIKLLAKLKKTFASTFPNVPTPTFEKITERGYIVPLLYSVGDVFSGSVEIEVHAGSALELIEKGPDKNQLAVKPPEKENLRIRFSDKEAGNNRVIEKQSISISKKTEEVKAFTTKEAKKDENKKEEVKKEEQKKEDTKREDPTRDNKLDAPLKKRQRVDKFKDIQTPNKLVKVDEDKKSAIANEPHRKEAPGTSSSEDSDVEIFSKDEKKPLLSKSSIPRT